MPPLTGIAIAAYAVTAAIYLGCLLGLRRSADVAGRITLGIALALQFADLGVRCAHGTNPISSTPEAIALVSFLIGLGYFIAALRYRLTAAGAFAVPASLLLLMIARLGPGEAEAPVMMGTLGRTHILLATVGVAVFALAAVLALLYLLEDRQLKRKRFDRMMRMGTPLDTLDRLALRCVSIGFPVFTIAIVTGALWIARLGLLTRPELIRPEYLFAVVTWVAFGVLLIARVGAGWRGRRAAWLTLGGFGGAMLVIVAYFLRHAA